MVLAFRLGLTRIPRTRRRFYWNVRGVQNRILNIAMSVGSSLNFQAASQGSREFAITFERYLNLIHFLCHAQTSPVLREIGWNQMQVRAQQWREVLLAPISLPLSLLNI